MTLKSESLNKKWQMVFMGEEHFDELLDESVAVYKPDGSPLIVLLKKALDPQQAANAWAVIKKINIKTDNRAVASGTKARPRKKIDGTLSSTMQVPKGWDVCSSILGSFERSIRLPFAHNCAWNSQNPSAFAQIFPLLQQTTKLFEKHVPNRFNIQKEYCKNTHPDWIIPGTVYTTLTVNKNFRTACHQDVGDLKTGFSNMFVIRQGAWKGAHLVLPNWRIAAKLDHLDLILFDPHEWHGNTQMLKLTNEDVRCSVVCYYREKLALCKSKEEEFLLAKGRKPGDALFPEIK